MNSKDRKFSKDPQRSSPAPRFVPQAEREQRRQLDVGDMRDAERRWQDDGGDVVPQSDEHAARENRRQDSAQGRVGQGYGQTGFGDQNYSRAGGASWNNPSGHDDPRAGQSTQRPTLSASGRRSFYDSGRQSAYERSNEFYGSDPYMAHPHEVQLSDEFAPRQDPRQGSDWNTTAYAAHRREPGSLSPLPEFFGLGPRGYVRSDARIREDVCERLCQGYLDARDIEVTVQDGTLILTGHVLSKQDRRLVEELVDDVLGVSALDNRLRVRLATRADQVVRQSPPTPAGEAVRTGSPVGINDVPAESDLSSESGIVHVKREGDLHDAADGHRAATLKASTKTKNPQASS